MTTFSIIDSDRTLKFAEELGLNPDSVMKKLFSAKVGIAISPEYLSTINGKITLEFQLDILSRMYADVIIEAGNLQQQTLQYLNSLIEKARNFQRNVNIGIVDLCDVKLLIGTSWQDKEYNFYIFSNGWEATVSPDKMNFDIGTCKINPVGAAMAASMGAAEIFKYVISDEFYKTNRKIEFKPIKFSTYSYQVNENNMENPELPDLIDIEDVAMIGAGAVGMAFISVLKHLGLKGKLEVIDHDVIDSSNLDRYLGVYKESIGIYKPHVVKKMLSHMKELDVACYRGKYNSFVETFGRFIDVAICTVDNDDTRHDLQCDLPKLILHGATGNSTFSVSRHDFLNGACLGCLYPIDPDRFKNEERFAKMLEVPVGVFSYKYENNIVLDQHEILKLKRYLEIPERLLKDQKGITLRDLLADRDVCGRFQLPSDMNIAGAVGFVSAMPGILLVGELIKERVYKTTMLKNTFHVNTLYGPNKHSHLARTKLPEKKCSCYCYDPIMIDMYKRKFENR